MASPVWGSGRFSREPKDQLVAEILDKLFKGDQGALTASRHANKQLAQWQTPRVEDPSEDEEEPATP